MIDCHYRRLGADGEFQVFDSTDGTRSNWDPEIQHGSPPLALMTKLIEELAADSGLRIGRMTLDILGAIPVRRVRVRAWVERPGTRISLMAAEMSAARPDGAERAVARVTAWLLATSDTADAATDRYPPLVEGEAVPVPHSWVGAKGYLETVSWRRQPEPARPETWCGSAPLCPWWIRSRRRICSGWRWWSTPPTALVRRWIHEQFMFMNTDTAVHLHRLPAGNDFALRARGSIGPTGSA